MRRLWSAILLGFAVLVTSVTLRAQSAASPSAGATGICRDGSYTFSATKRGACSRHGGVQQWITEQAPATKAPTRTTPPTTGTPTAGKSAETPASGVKVWVNLPTNVYHCPGSRWYGQTKKGTYMSESEAKAAGARPAYGKACA